MEGSLNGASDGVVSLTSASLSFAESDQRTRIVPYCHITPGLLTPLGMSCYAPNKGIAYIDSASHMTFQIVDSFLAGNSNWQSIGHPPSLDTAGYLSQYGGFIFGETSAAGAQINLGQAAFGSVNLQNSPSSDGLFYNEFVSGTGNFTTSTPGAISCGPFTEPPGYYSAVRCKPSPQISNVGPLLQNAPGWVVASGAAITISGIGFGQTRCSACQVLAYPGPVALQISSWSDTAITATLPSTFSGFAQVFVQNAVGQDYINIMAAAIPSSLTIQTNPSGLQFSIDGGPLQTAPQTLSLSAGSTHTVAVSLTQLGAAVGTQYAFLSWSDGGAATHTFVVNSSGTLTAAYKTQYQLTTSAVPASGGTVSPASGGYYDAGTVVSLTATANSGYLFSAWSGTVANAGSVSTTVTMSNLQTVTANFKAANIPIISSSGVVPLDSSIPVIQPGSWISIYGSNLANSTVVWNDDFPLSLGGVSVTINKKPGYLWFVSPGQINLQAPDDSATGLVPVVVTTPNGTATSTVTLAASGPSFSLFNSRYAAGVILTPNGSGAYDGGVYDLLGPVAFFNFNTRPVKAGEVLELYGVGFGPTSPPVPAGQVFGGAAPTVQPVTVAIGGVSATVLFSGLTSAGLYQLNVVVPNVASGDQPLQAIVSGGIQTPAGVYITVQ